MFTKLHYKNTLLLIIVDNENNVGDMLKNNLTDAMPICIGLESSWPILISKGWNNISEFAVNQKHLDEYEISFSEIIQLLKGLCHPEICKKSTFFAIS